VALNKQSYQVSTFTDQFGTTYAANLANDGNVNSCARSLSETNPWWAVDLGVETLVAQVNLTNRGDDDGISLRLLSHELCLYYTSVRRTTRYGLALSTK